MNTVNQLEVFRQDMTKARVLEDSRSTEIPWRLTTMEVTFPRFILAEFNTHRRFSRNSASSRAIPIKRQFELIRDNPFIPKAFSINKPGMSADEHVYPDDKQYNELASRWLKARDDALKHAEWFAEQGIHKQHTNRLIEPFMWHTVIVSATEWDNFWKLRISPAAQPEINDIALAMQQAYNNSNPRVLSEGEWHLPLTNSDDGDLRSRIIASVARVAAVSYNRHTIRDEAKEQQRFYRLASSGHWSPFEHIATPSDDPSTWANFDGWTQARHFFERGEGFAGVH